MYISSATEIIVLLSLQIDFFFSLIALARTFGTILNEHGKNGHRCFVPSLKGKAFSISLLSIMVALSHQIRPLLYWGGDT